MDQTTAGSGYRAVLRIRSFRLLVLGTSTSEIGDWLYNVALLIYVFDQTQSAAWVGAATIGRLLPYAVLAPFGGVLADRFDRVRVMVATCLARLLIFAGMTVAVALDASALLVIALAVLGTVAGVPYRPASSALLPRLVGEGRMAPASALLGTLCGAALVGGPALGAAVLAFGPPAVAFGINAATFAVAAVAVGLIRPPARRSVGGVEARELPSPLVQFVEGMRAIRTTPFIPVITALVAFSTFSYGAQTVLLVLYAEQRLGSGADGYGYLIAAVGVGGILAGVVVGRFAGRPRLGVLLVGVSAVFCATSAAYATTSLLVVALLVGVLTGLVMVMSDVLSDVLITRAVPSDLLGRIYGGLEGLVALVAVLGALVAPSLVALAGLLPSLLLVGGVTTVLSVVALPAVLRLDRTAAQVAAERAESVRVLGAATVFAGADPATLERLAGAATEEAVPAGVAVVTQGEAADALYVVLEGELEVSSTGEAGAEPAVVATLAAGDAFGEIGLLGNMPRTATVRTTTPGRLLRINGADFLDALADAAGGLAGLREGARVRLARTHPSSPALAAEQLGGGS